jgi:hypothetical protein
MIRTLLPLLLLAGCTPTLADQAPVTGPESVAPNGEEGGCRTDELSDLVGKPGTAEVAKEALRRSGARTFRRIEPGMAVTMDYRHDRLNMDTDANGTVTRFHCG